MAKLDDSQSFDWGELPRPNPERVKRSAGPPVPKSTSIGRIMVWLVYFAMVSLAIREYTIFPTGFHAMTMGVSVGLGIAYFGYWSAMRLQRFSFLGWIIFIIGYLAIIAATTGTMVIATVPILIGAIIYLCFRHRSNNQDALLGIIALAADRGMPLAPGVLAFSHQVHGMIKIWAETLAELLRRGVSLADAAGGMPRLIPRSPGLLIRMGTESGNLARGLREAVQARSIRLPMARKIGTQMAYLAWVACVGFFIVGFLSYFIMPKFEAIFHDFGITLPEVTILMIQLSHRCIDFFYVPVLAFLAFAIAMLVNLFRGGDLSLPLIDRLFARRHTILILRSLVLFVEADQPISVAMNALSQWYPTLWVRKKLSRVSAEINRGQDWIGSLRATGLVTSADAGVLTSAQRAGNLAWAVRELILTSERRWDFRLQALMQLAFIGSMLGLGAIVFLLAVAYFAPLTTLIMRLS